MQKKRGRKGYGQELRIIERYSDLSELYFMRLKERLESEDKKEQDLALTLLNTAFQRMIPQSMKLGGDKDNPIPVAILNGKTNVQRNNSNSEDTATEQEG